MSAVKVAVDGYGVIGKRVADAVTLQPDMELVGVADVVADYRTRLADGVEAPNSVIEITRDLGRPRADLWEVAVWEDTLAVGGREVFLTYQVHNEAIVIPENVDAIRVVTAAEPDGAKSIATTDAALGVRKELS